MGEVVEEIEDSTPNASGQGTGDAAAAVDTSAEHDPASPGAENRSAKDLGDGGDYPTAAKATDMVGPTDFKALKAGRASKIAARPSAPSGAAAKNELAPVGGEGDVAPSPPLGEATNTSKVAPRSKIPTVRRSSRRARGAV